MYLCCKSPKNAVDGGGKDSPVCIRENPTSPLILFACSFTEIVPVSVKVTARPTHNYSKSELLNWCRHSGIQSNVLKWFSVSFVISCFFKRKLVRQAHLFLSSGRDMLPSLFDDTVHSEQTTKQLVIVVDKIAVGQEPIQRSPATPRPTTLSCPLLHLLSSLLTSLRFRRLPPVRSHTSGTYMKDLDAPPDGGPAISWRPCNLVEALQSVEGAAM